MKRLIPAGILLLTVILAYFFSMNYVTNTCERTNELIKMCETEYSESGTAEKTAAELKQYWSEKEDGLSFFVNHERIDDIELEIASLVLLSKKESEVMFYEHIENLKMLLHQVKEDTRINIHSIF